MLFLHQDPKSHGGDQQCRSRYACAAPCCMAQLVWEKQGSGRAIDSLGTMTPQGLSLDFTLASLRPFTQGDIRFLVS
jgi:hypothetical protein